MTELRDIINQELVDIICLTELGLNYNTNQLKHIDSNLSFFVKDIRLSTPDEEGNTHRIPPRAAMIVAKSLINNFVFIENLSSPDVAVGRLKYTEPMGNVVDVVIVSMYCDRNIDIVLDLKIMENISNFALEKNSKLLICTDANSHHNFWGNSSDERGDALMAFLIKNNMQVHNDGFATFHTGSAIDLTISSNSISHKIYDWKCDRSDSRIASDHYPIYFCIDGLRKETVDFRNPRRTNWRKFIKILSCNLKKEKRLTTSDECEKSASELVQALNVAFESSTKISKINLDSRNHSSPHTQALKEDMNAAWRKKRDFDEFLCINQTPEQIAETKKKLEDDFKKLRSEHCIAITESETRSRNKFLNDIKGYNEAARMTSIKKATNKQITSIEQNGILATTDIEIGQTVSSCLFPMQYNEEQKQKQQMYTLEYSRKIRRLTTDEKITAAVMRFGKYKSPGVDRIYPIMLQNSLDITLPHLREIFRFSFQTGFIPKILLEIKCILLRKSGKEADKTAKAYRPISLMSFLLKTMEQLICTLLKTALDHLDKSQYAYLRFRSGTEALNDVVTFIENVRADKRKSWGCWADCAGAFDCLNHETVYRNLKRLKMDNFIIEWVKTLLQFRVVKLTILEHTTLIYPKCGVPQGSVLACRLWIICVDELIIELRKKIPGIFIVVFSDDLHFQIEGIRDDFIGRRFTRAINFVIEWCDANGLSINPDKCTFIRFAKKKMRVESPKVNNKTINFSDEVKYLGVIIHKKLNWSRHIDYVCKNTMKYVGNLKRYIGKNWGFRQEFLSQIYNCVVVPKITYASCVWLHALSIKSNRKKIEICHNKALRALTACFANTPALLLETLLNVKSIYDSLIERTLFEVLRLNTLNKWDLERSDSHYFVNVMFKKILGENFKYDKIKCQKKMSKVSICIPSKKQWKRNRVHSDGFKQIFIDASVDKAINRTGYAAISNDLDINFEKYENRIVSSFKAELTAMSLALYELRKLDVRNSNIAIYCDNQALVRMIGKEFISSLLIKRIDFLCRQIESNNNVLKIYWVPAHQSTIVQSLVYEIAMNEKVDILTRSEQAIQIFTNPPLMKQEVKNMLDLRSKKRRVSNWSSYKGPMECFDVGKMAELQLYAEENSIRKVDNIRIENFIHPRIDISHLSRTNIFRIISLISGANFLSSLMSRIDNRSAECRMCRFAYETSRHVFFECPVLSQMRRKIFGTIESNTITYRFSLKNILRMINATTIKNLLSQS